MMRVQKSVVFRHVKNPAHQLLSTNVDLQVIMVKQVMVDFTTWYLTKHDKQRN